MKRIIGLILFTVSLLPLRGQEWADTLATPLTDPLSEAGGYTGGFFDEEDPAGYFLPTASGNGNYAPVGQLARGLIGMRFRTRGYDNRYLGYVFEGVELADPTDGFPYWNVLSGLNLISPVHADVAGIAPAAAMAGGVGGVTALSLPGGSDRRTGRISYALSNRSYRHRVTAQNHFQLAERWSLRLGVSGHTGEDGYVKGLFSNRLQASGALTGIFGRQQQHALTLLLTATRSEQGVRSAATQEVYDLVGDNYYNPNLGIQNGALRNSRTRSYRQAMPLIAYTGRLNAEWTLRAAAAGFGGENAYTLPTWYDAPTPYPDYYRYLPDFYADPAIGEALREGWAAGDPAVSQIDWTKMYEANLYNTDENGIARSHYVLRDLVTDKRNLSFAVSAEYRPDNNLTVRGGIRARADRSDNYARLNDLLGGRYWRDIDQYLLDDEYYGAQYQNDIRNPDRPVFEGQRFGYSYLIRAKSVKAWGSVDYRTRHWSAFAAAEAGSTGFQREGMYEKELFPGNLSYGRSEMVRFQEYMLKGGAFYHFTLRHRLGLQALIGAQAPTVRGLFVAPSFRNATVDDPTTVGVRGAEVVYQWVTPRLRIDATGYYTDFSDESEVRNFYDDIDGEYMNLALRGIDKRHIGAEAGVEWNVTPRFSLLGVVATGVFQYANDPAVALYRDSDGEMLLDGGITHLSGYRLAGTPQTAAMVQGNFRTRSYWNFQLSARYTAHNYVSLNPVRRMGRALDGAGSPEMRREMAEQERLDDGLLIGMSVSKTFRLRNGDSFGFWINADNLMNDKTIRYSGYEQWRFSRTSAGAGETLRPFPSKYYYAAGVNFYAMVSYTF